MILLDLFCGEGGAAAGYMRAGFDVVGVDVKDYSHRYPGVFVQGDALDFLARNGSRFHAIHASPPCQGYTIATAGNRKARGKHERLIAATRAGLSELDVPWVIENVEQARSQMVDPILLCGRMFGLGAFDEDGVYLTLDRHRLFESNVDLMAPGHPKHGDEQVGGVYDGARHAPREPGESLASIAPKDRASARYGRKGGYVPRSKRVKEELLGIDWMSVHGLYEAIPPVYAECVGWQLARAAAVRERAA